MQNINPDYTLIKNKIQITPRIANTNLVDALIKTIETSNINANTKPKLKNITTILPP